MFKNLFAKVTLLSVMAALVAAPTFAADKKKKEEKSNKPVFTIVKQLPITSVKNQNRSGTCWAYSTLSFFESEILKKTGKAVRVAELCHRAMPYPLIVILHDGNAMMLSMAEKRCSRDGKKQVVLERIVNTDWILETALSDFRNAADFDKNRKLSFKELYLHYIELLEILQCAVITGEFKENDISSEERRALLGKMHHLNQHLAAIKAKAKTETELSRQVELNIQAKQLEHEISEIQKKL